MCETFKPESATLRDYYAVNAPTIPEMWFRPVVEPKPTSLYKSIDGSFNSLDKSVMENRFGSNYFDVNEKLIKEWLMETVKQRDTQWRYAWADAMLERRDK